LELNHDLPGTAFDQSAEAKPLFKKVFVRKSVKYTGFHQLLNKTYFEQIRTETLKTKITFLQIYKHIKA